MLHIIPSPERLAPLTTVAGALLLKGIFLNRMENAGLIANQGFEGKSVHPLWLEPAPVSVSRPALNHDGPPQDHAARPAEHAHRVQNTYRRTAERGMWASERCLPLSSLSFESRFRSLRRPHFSQVLRCVQKGRVDNSVVYLVGIEVDRARETGSTKDGYFLGYQVLKCEPGRGFVCEEVCCFIRVNCSNM